MEMAEDYGLNHMG
jgi:hypothetical protein